MKKRYFALMAASILTIGALGGCAAKDDPKEDGNMKDAEAAYAAELPTEKTLAAASEDPAEAETAEKAGETAETEITETEDAEVAETTEATTEETGKAEATEVSDASPEAASAEKVQGSMVTVSKDHLALNKDGSYTFKNSFKEFSGELANADEVTKFTLKVYDKNDILIYEAKIDPKEKWSTKDFAFIYGLDKFVFEASTGKDTYSDEVLIDCEGNYNFDKLYIDEEDLDGDGLCNYFEKYFGTDEKKTDTDGDGLTDYQELYTLGYDPLKKDSDGDGIPDQDEDEDGDGISNIDEYKMGSSPIFIDSDHDRALDADELRNGTSLSSKDTDGDGISDYDKNVLDQMKAVHNADGTYTAVISTDRMGYYDKATIPSAEVTGDAEALLSFNIGMVTNNVYLNATMVGYMGHAYIITTEGKFAGAELSFTYDKALIDPDMAKAADFCPAIYYMDPDDEYGMLDEVANQTRNGNIVTAHIDKMGYYILCNKTDLDEFWNRPFEW